MRFIRVLLAGFLLLLTQTASAGTGGVTRLPIGKLNTTGVTLVVDSRGIDAVGYRPVRVTITAIKPPAKEDRQFRIVLKPFGNKDQVSQVVELKEGTAQGTATILAPQDADWNLLGIDVFEGGRLLEELSADRHGYPKNQWDWNESAPGILVIDSEAPQRDQRDKDLYDAKRHSQSKQVADPFEGKKFADIRNLILKFKVENNYNNNNSGPTYYAETGDAMVIMQEIVNASKTEILPPADLPERWLEFSSFDLIFISKADLVALREQHPEKLRAIAEWVRSGRTLIVYESGEDFTGLAAIEKALQLPARPDADSKDFRGWRVPDTKQRGHSLLNYSVDNYGRYYGPRQRNKGATKTSVLALNVEEAPDNARPDKTWAFVIRPAGLGQVVAFEGNPFPGTGNNWDWLFNSLHGSWNPMHRTGATMQQRNEDFWNFLIAGIGQAPVFSFLLLITLFVTLIGPVNYYYLQRRQRLYLLLVTVPLGALVVTFGLFSYAVLVDGLGVKTRVRSVTLLDQRSGTGASVSRQAYYAAVAPSQGFGFVDDTEVRPYVHRPPRNRNDRYFQRTVAWDEHDQRLRSGFISSRTLAQLLVTKVDKTKARLHVGKPVNGRLPVTNELQTNLAWLLVKHTDGNYYAAADIKAGATELKAITPGDAADELKSRLKPFQPEFPEGYSEAMHDTPLEWLDGGPYRNWQPSPAEQATSLLERALARYAQLSSHPLEPGTYVALAESSPLVPLGIKARQVGSLNVIEGNY